jgi:hypothetical protein
MSAALCPHFAHNPAASESQVALWINIETCDLFGLTAVWNLPSCYVLQDREAPTALERIPDLKMPYPGNVDARSTADRALREYGDERAALSGDAKSFVSNDCEFSHD